MASASECPEFAHESLCWAKTARSERESAIFLQKAHAWLLAASKLAGYQVNDTESVGWGNSARNGRGPTLHAIREPCTIVVRPARACHSAADPAFRRRFENTSLRVAPSRSHFETGRVRFQSSKKPAWRVDGLERKLLRISAILFFAGSVGWCWLVFSEFRSPILVSPAEASIHPHISHCQRFNRCRGKANSEIGKLDPFSSSTYARSADPHVTATLGTSLGRKSPARIVAREWSRLHTRVARLARAPAKHAAKEPKPNLKPPVRLASLEGAAPPAEAVPSRIPSNVGALTSLVEFETAPFPYHGTEPETGRPFLNAGNEGHRGHVNFRGQVLWESQTFRDNRVLLHIPPGFKPKHPAVMVVFFHGHGANLAQDVRDRQRVPTQITAAGVNAVLVAPQFAVDAADSSAGKFWEPNGFKRFLDEAAVKLARMYGDPRSAFTFARMPIVIVAYSGGFGPTLSVLDQGGVRSRVRGLILLDALYAGIDKFADWIADNRSTFFVSSYTSHTAYHNAYLERLLRERSVPYSSELRDSHLRGMVTFLPAGDISHHDFVTHAWADNPIRDILVRLDNADQRIESARTGSISAGVVASRRN
jgi:hypothetical protein